MAESFRKLESNDTTAVVDTKQKLHEQFNMVSEPWLLNGLYDYYTFSNSLRSVEILANIREPHHGYLLNRISDVIRNSKNEGKVQALTLLGHIVRRQPPWVYKIAEHHLLRDIIRLLKTETDILIVISALLVLIVLLPIAPALVANCLSDVFEIFSRLASWNSSNQDKLMEDQMLHLQVALYALFQKLYGMYPCNFLAYLRHQYRHREHFPIFVHTIKPMLTTVKLHPSLVTASKDKEITIERWRELGSHDVVIECEKYALDILDRCQHESCYLTSSFRSRSGTTNSTILESSNHLESLKSTSLASLAYEARDYFSPCSKLLTQTPVSNSSVPTPIPHSHMQGVGQGLVASIGLSSQEGTSPPEAAIEATPETTPIKDLRHTPRSQLPSSTTAVRALSTLTSKNWSIGSSSTTPNHSQPSSPMRKESSPFNFPTENRTSAFALPRREPYTVQKLQRMMQDRTQVVDGEPLESGIRSKTPVLHPTSPLRIIPTSEVGNLYSPIQRIESPVSQEDEEVLEIVRQGQLEERPTFRQCDSVLQENEEGKDEDLDEIEQEHGSPCTAGGLHMPNSRSMSDFAQRVRRLRYHSHCGIAPELPESSTDTNDTTDTRPGDCEPFTSNTVRRAISCPEMEKNPVVPIIDNRNKTLVEADEDTNKENLQDDNKQTQKSMTSTETQTDNFWAMPYEHLFLGIFPTLGGSDVKSSPAPSSDPNSDPSSDPKSDPSSDSNSVPTSDPNSAPSAAPNPTSNAAPNTAPSPAPTPAPNSNATPAPSSVATPAPGSTATPTPGSSSAAPAPGSAPNPVPSPAPSSVTTSETSTESSSDQSGTPAPTIVQDKFLTVSPYEILDRYIAISAKRSKRDPEGGKYEREARELKDQVKLFQQQLLFERHRRETHAFKNRRLLADAKNAKALEEHNSALRDQVQLQQRDIDNLKEQLESIKSDKHCKGRQGFESVQLWESKYISLQQEHKLVKQKLESMQRELENLKVKSVELSNKQQVTEGALLDANTEVKIAKEQAWAGEKGKAELLQVNKELLISLEMQLRYQEKLSQLSLLKKSEQELTIMSEVYNHELKGLRQQLDSKMLLLEVYKARIAELEHIVNQNEECYSTQKRLLGKTKEEYDVKLKAVESKYQTQLTICRALQEKILELWQQIESITRQPLHSPDTSSCHEVHATLTDRTSIATGLSPHSSPLSASLASSEGSAAFGRSDSREMKNLQFIVDQRESTASTSTSKITASEEEVVIELGTGTLLQTTSFCSRQD